MDTKNKKLKSNTVGQARRRKRMKKIVAALVFLALVIAAGVVIFLLVQSSKNSASKTDNNGSNSAESSEAAEKSSSTEDSNASKEPSSDDPENQAPVQYEGENPNKSATLTGLISFAGVSEGRFLVNVAIDQYVSGICKFAITGPNNAQITSSADTVAGPSSTFCSYSGPVPASGTYNITVTVETSDKTGTITGEAKI